MPDAIVLVGLSGSGKSSVGRQVAERLGRPFLDLDDAITRHTGRTPARLIEQDGEAAFRAIEAAEVQAAVAVPDVVIATGGGAVIDPLSRWQLWEAGIPVWLDAPDERLTERVRRHAEKRPLLAGDPRARLAALRREREPFYAAAEVRITGGGSTASVAESVIRSVRAVQTRSGRLFDAQVRRDHRQGAAEARITYGRDLSGGLADLVAPLTRGEPVVVADRTVAAALPDLVAALPGERRLVIEAGERAKRMPHVERLLEDASALRAERGDAWVAVGGGTTGDLVGTAAAFYLRGVPLIQLPTTWLALSDSALGGKVAVDLSGAKNAAGAFWPPVAVIGDVATLRTLPRQLLLDGLAEVIKSAIIGDPWLWDLLETRGPAALGDTPDGIPDEAARYAMVERSVRLKLGVVDRDPFEQGERRTLNLGHTLGHALEIESDYALPHGQAVVLGLRAVTAIAEGRGAVTGLAERIDDLLARFGYAMTRSFDIATVKAALGTDKKRVAGRQHWILPLDIGTVIDVDDVTEVELDRAIARITPRVD
ncbi:MAG: iron-containing alcohol dehydrogenase [Chloroflexi bacterium]|nr:iron-containing alcohol dehydrogenase [Chloroflexota bacterium]